MTAGDEGSAKNWKRDRRVYIAGPNEGQPRPSAATRRRRRAGAAHDRLRGRMSAIQRLVEQLETQEVEDATSEASVHGGQVVKFRLGRGYRQEREGMTQYSLDSDEEDEWRGKLVVLCQSDMDSGERWFGEGHPDWMLDKHSNRELGEKASGMGGDHGKVFVEYHGRWYEACQVK